MAVVAHMGSPQNCFSGFLQSSELSKLQKEYQSLKDDAQKAAAQQSLEHDKLRKELEATKLELQRLHSIRTQGTKCEKAAEQIQVHTRKFLKRLWAEREMREQA